MKYIEHQSELVVGRKYVCITYGVEETLTLEYVGDGRFEDDEYFYVLDGDIRYVLNEPTDAPQTE